MINTNELQESASEFLFGLLKHSYYFTLFFLVEPFDFLSFITGLSLTLPHKFVWFLGGPFILAAFHTYHVLRLEKRAVDQLYEQATSRRLEFVSGTGEPFEHLQTVSDSQGNQGSQRLFRVGIRNVGGITINRVQLELESISPSTSVKCPVPLHFMHDNPPAGMLPRREFPLDAEQTCYVDVVSKQEWSISGGHPLHIHHTIQGVSFRIDPGNYQLTLFAHGDNVSSIRMTFLACVDPNNRLAFRQSS
jgi:hypothetical protein